MLWRLRNMRRVSLKVADCNVLLLLFVVKVSMHNSIVHTAFYHIDKSDFKSGRKTNDEYE
ncbi:hypothetical protein KSX_06840 [Ktedonospora formicarum]|uniref:Uncharacterized protein n=1 Tax=Ktedonospora formicarum TaxID=2778364 RepID=A0A8J3MQ94_9CHLR|nr:hypothetical protein KSX_06840 [Ktedonospora formicarum]